jgi:hypothetical protein
VISPDRPGTGLPFELQCRRVLLVIEAAARPDSSLGDWASDAHDQQKERGATFKSPLSVPLVSFAIAC